MLTASSGNACNHLRQGILDSLTEEQQDQLLTWLEILPVSEVLEKVAAPPPDGFNIKTHVTSLRRFQERAQIDGRADDLRLARRGHLNSEDRTFLQRTATDALTHRAFQLATRQSNKAFRHAALWVARLQELQLRERQIALAEAQLELERQKLQVHLAIKEAQSSTEHEENKLKAARELIAHPPRNPA